MPIGLNQVVDRGINTALTRRLGLTPDATVALMPELAPTLNIGPVPEIEYHLGWRKYMAAATIAADAVNFGTLRIRIPRVTTQGVICIVDGVYMVNTAGAASGAQIKVAGSIGTTDLATILGAQARDTLQPATKPGTAVVSVAAAADQGVGGGGLYGSWNMGESPIFPLVMRPSLIAGTALDGYQFQYFVTNQSVDVCIVYRERTLNDQENVP